MKRFALPLLALAVFEIPVHAWADVPVIDKTVLQQDTERNKTTRKIETTDKDRHTINTSVTCAMPGHPPQRSGWRRGAKR